MIHSVQQSDRYRKAMRLLGRARGATSIELAALGDCAPHSTVSDLRQGGKNIGPAKDEGRTAGGRKIFRYRLTK